MQNATSWFSAKPKWFRVSTYLVLFYLIYALLLGVVTPVLLEVKLPDIVKENTGRNATVKDIAINPFLLKIGVTDFVIYPESKPSTTSDSDELSKSSNESDTNNELSRDRFFSVDNISLDIGFWQSLFTLTPAVESISVNSPYAKVARLNSDNDTQTFNFSDILAHLAKHSKNDEEEEVSDEQPPRITLGQFILSNGHIVLEDEVTETLLDYPELGVALQDLDTHAVISVNDNSQVAFNQYQFDLLTAEKGKISIKGEFQLSPFKVATDVVIRDVALTPLWSLSKDLVEAKLVDGTVDLSLQAQAFEEGDTLHFLLEGGEFAVNNLVFNSTASSSAPDSASTSKEILAIPAFAIHEINVNGAEQQVNIGDVAVDDVRVTGLFDESGLNLQRLFTPKSLTASATQTSTNASTNSPARTGAKLDTKAQANIPSSQLEQETTWQVTLQKFAFNNGTVKMLERSVSDGTYYRISHFDIESGEITTDFSKPISYTTSLQVSADTQAFSTTPKGAITSSGNLVIAEQTVKGKAAIEQLVINQFQQYVSPYANVLLEKGVFNLNVEFDATMGDEGTEALNVKASTKVSDLSVLDDANEPLLQWQTLTVDDVNFDLTSNQLSVDNIQLQSPFARLIIDEAKQTNVSKLVVASKKDNNAEQSAKSDIAGEPGSTNSTNSAASETSQKTSSNAKELAIVVNAISIENGKAYFADHSLTPKFASAIESLNGKVSGIDSRSDTPANVDITGKIDNYAPVKLAGTIHPLKSELDLDFSVNGAELTSVNPYSGTYMGYYIDKGLLSLAVQYKLKGKALEGKNHVVIDQLTLGRKSNSDQALSLPLGLAIALLEDSNGVIDLGLDVSGDVDSPDFSFGSIILNAIGNIITKAVTAPFSLLANLVGSDDELDSVAFTFGEYKLNAETKEKLNTLAEALKKRPGLRVNIEGAVNAVSDASLLAQHQLNTTLFAKSGLVEPSTISSNESANESTAADGEIESLSDSRSSQDKPLTGSRIPLEGPLADALISHYVEMFTPDLDQEYKKMVAKLYPELASEGEGQNSSDDTIDTINEEDVQRALTIARYNKLRNSIDIPESALTELADLRSKAVKSYLANEGEIEANRLFLLNSQHDLHTEFSGVELTLEAN